jgi:ATP-dependent helicase/nuclease subunit B
MYDWLDIALRDSSQVITASRRLARVLRKEYAAQRVLAGDTVWPTPVIQAWTDWMADLIRTHGDQNSLPTVITAHQSRILWERCLRREISDPLLNIGMLARQSRDAWSRLQEWQVSVAECQQHVRNRDQGLFAAAANNYQSILEREFWVDESGIAKVAIELIHAKSVAIPKCLTLAGFDRVSPLLQALLDAYIEAGGELSELAGNVRATSETQILLYRPENGDAELRAAGAWARRELSQNPDARLAIVVTHLEQNAPRSLRLIKEGLIPGWQNASSAQNSVVNISYGKKLSEYPAISMALLALAWLHRDLSTRDISSLLRSSVFNSITSDARIRAELRLRDLPEQTWSQQQLLTLFNTRADRDAASDGLDIVRKLASCREQLPQRQSPEKWVSFFSELLLGLSWPGTESLSSAEFQTVNRWRELLNEFARLALVVASMTAAEALGRIATIAGETIFQPEGGNALVNVMGPLEAAGLEFDRLWVTGMSSANWPPMSRSLTLVSRDLQRDHGMPDATPTDTLEYATRVIVRLAGSASESVFSYPETQSDAQQSVSELLAAFTLSTDVDCTDPGWNAVRHVGSASISHHVPDPVPAVLQDERIVGGAATIQRQFIEPFAAFVSGRLGVRGLWPMQAGLPANIRGSLIHNALHRLYSDCPGRDQIRQWGEAEIEDRTDKAVQAAFRRHEQHADTMLQQLLRLEKIRVKDLLRGVIAVDCGRDDFRISGVEQDLEITLAGLVMRLRVDRIDVDRNDGHIILDYKTGVPKRLLDRDKNPKDMQLIVYARAIGENVSGIGLFNIDSRDIALDAAGHDLSPKLDWDSSLADWQGQVENAAQQIASGDVRISALLNAQQARPLSLLSRYRELLHDS